MTPVGRSRWLLVLVALAVGILGLPLVALVLDSAVDENLLLPIQMVVAGGTCAVVGYLRPEVAGEGASRGRGAVVGVIAGLLATMVGFVFWLVAILGLFTFFG